ncbi:MAG: 4a-hydroxytetrahydrobiopterin dehydratase [Leptospira sp.]|jgi:4a-hydroxytetrahydrobiopterin dehydratase|nr:4a-hydroxytetrahydrobiopterin dehydratase [Leptospira sp.]
MNDPNSRYSPLTIEDLNKALEKYKAWEIITEDSQLKCFAKFSFQNFSFAFAFLSQIAMISEELNHHAELWNLYNTVTIKIYTHETKSISKIDLVFIEKVSEVYSSYK